MPAILITAPLHSGKTSLAYGLLARLSDSGLSAAYCKPFSPTPDADADYVFASEVLVGSLGISAGPPPRAISQDVNDLAPAVQELSRQNQIVVETTDGSPAVALAEAVDARAVEILSYSPERNWADAVDEAAVRWGSRLAGVVVNAVPTYRRDSVAAGAAASDAAVEVVVIPESRVMIAPTVAQIAEGLEAAWTLDPINEDALIERYLIGGNIMDNGPTYYGRYSNQAVITRTQRPDIQLASMLPQTRCLVLTGPGEPTEYVKAEARERDIPLLQVSTSTIDTADALERLLTAATAHSLEKVRHFAGLLDQHAGAQWLAGLSG